MSWDYLRNREVTWKDRREMAWGMLKGIGWLWCIGLFLYGMSGGFNPESGIRDKAFNVLLMLTFDGSDRQRQRLKNRGKKDE